MGDVRLWMQEDCVSHSQMRAGGWTTLDVAVESGAVLKAYSMKGTPELFLLPHIVSYRFLSFLPILGSDHRPPPHSSFSYLKFISSSGADGGVLEDNEVEYDQNYAHALDGNEVTWSSRKNQNGFVDEKEVRGSWLEADDIEDF